MIIRHFGTEVKNWGNGELDEIETYCFIESFFGDTQIFKEKPLYVKLYHFNRKDLKLSRAVIKADNDHYSIVIERNFDELEDLRGEVFKIVLNDIKILKKFNKSTGVLHI